MRTLRLALLMLPAVPLFAEDVQPQHKYQWLTGVDLKGKLHRIADDPDCRAVGLVFLATECPISNSYVPRLNRLGAGWRRHGVELYGVISFELQLSLRLLNVRVRRLPDCCWRRRPCVR